MFSVTYSPTNRFANQLIGIRANGTILALTFAKAKTYTPFGHGAQRCCNLTKKNLQLF
jgi:hypothetical protein